LARGSRHMAFLSLEEAAKKLGMAEDALRALAKDKKIRSMLDSGKLIFKDTEVDAYLAKNPPTAETRIPADEDLVLNLGDDSSGDSFSLGGSSDEHPILLDEPAEQSGDSLVLDDSSGIGLLPDDIELSANASSAEQTMMITAESDSDSGSSDVRGVVPTPADSSSDFDLDPGQGSDSEFTLGSDALSFPSGEDSASGTGLNIDDGSSGTFMLDESSSIFELEASEAIDGGSDSNFEINLEDSSGMVEGGEIALDSEMLEDDGSGSVAIPVDEDGELAVEDSGDQVVALDEEGDVNAETVAAPSRRRKATLLEEEPIEATDEALEDLGDDGEGNEAFVGGAAAVAGAGAVAVARPWGPLPALVLLPTVIGLVLLTLMSFEILNSVIGFFNGTKTSSLILKPMMEFIDPASAKLLD
ncbi:MAG: helix-turn-helix domain-containing protein, partial [Gemmataceae bacterium]